MEAFSFLLADGSEVVNTSMLSWVFISALINIIIIDIMLAGDNAIVIAMAARNLPAELQKKAIIWGTMGAIVVRSIMTLVATFLLTLPALRLVGGVLLFWIAYKLLTGGGENTEEKAPAASFRAALLTIIIADTVMGIDNVLAVAGAAQGAGEHNFLLVILGLIISIPIMVFASRLILRMLERFPIIIYIGAGVLVKVAVDMIIADPIYAGEMTVITSNPLYHWLIIVVALVIVLGGGYLRQAKAAKNQ